MALINPAVLRSILSVAGVIAVFLFGYSKGKDAVLSDWAEEKLVKEQQTYSELKRALTASSETVASYEAKLSAALKNTTTIIKKVPYYVPSDSCSLPAGFRVLHNAAATATLPRAAEGSVAAPGKTSSDPR